MNREGLPPDRPPEKAGRSWEVLVARRSERRAFPLRHAKVPEQSVDRLTYAIRAIYQPDVVSLLAEVRDPPRQRRRPRHLGQFDAGRLASLQSLQDEPGLFTALAHRSLPLQRAAWVRRDSPIIDRK